jgi:hypothetical protein
MYNLATSSCILSRFLKNEVGWPNEIPEEGRSDKIMSLHLQKTDIFMRLIDEGKIPLR